VPSAVTRLTAVALAALATGLITVAPAAADQYTATSGHVTATFRFDQPAEYEYTDLRLTVIRAGAIAFDEPIDIASCEEPYCVPAGTFADDGGITVRDLDGDGEPEVIADVFTGGAHCCLASEILRWDGTGYRARERNWADVGYKLADADHDGVPEFKTADTRFAYVFASFADSRFPIKLLSYRQGKFTDVTRANKPLIRRDAKALKREYRKRRGNGLSLGVLAAWTADQYLLGRKRAAVRYLRAENRAGKLRSLAYWKSGSAYIRLLKRRLHRWGY
jgi:hypothetical protein